MGDMDWSDSTLGDFAGVEKKLLVAFGASEAAWKDAKNFEAKGFCVLFDGCDRFFVERFVFDDAARADVFATEFELGFDKDEENCAGLCNGNSWTKNFCDRDERNVGDDEIDRFGNVSGLEFARIAPNADDARVLLKFPGELARVYVDGVDARGACLEQAVGEAARGRAEVEADGAGWIHGKVGESAFQFKAAAARIFLQTACDFDLCGFVNLRAGFFFLSAIDADFARENHGLRLLAGFGEAAFDE